MLRRAAALNFVCARKTCGSDMLDLVYIVLGCALLGVFILYAIGLRRI